MRLKALPFREFNIYEVRNKVWPKAKDKVISFIKVWLP